VSWWEAVILGLVQGLTEFLPISSSAHLRIVGELIGSSDPGAAFTAITQIGTESAVLLYFRRDIARITVAWWRALTGGTDLRSRFGGDDPDARMAWWIVLGSIPIVVIGLSLQDYIVETFRNLYLIAGTLAVFAIVLGWADRIGEKRHELEHLGVRDAVLFGFAQALALIPGVSRSGGTITGGLLLGYSRSAAARYSFLLAIPAVLGSGVQQLVTNFDVLGTAGTPSLAMIILAALIAFVVGYVVIIGFLRLVSTYSYMPFVVYRIGLAALVIVLLFTGVLEPYGGA
jgi:undecaprenyl-diphosphatase